MSSVQIFNWYCVCIYLSIYWGIGNDADNYSDGSHNLYAILKMIYTLKNK